MKKSVYCFATILLSLGCKASDNPVDPGPKPGQEWDHCPDPIQSTEDENWAGQIEVTNGALYCQRPIQFDNMDKALTLTKQLRLVAGTYRLPTAGDNHAVDLPFCFRDAEGPLESTVPGIANAGTSEDFANGTSWFVNGKQNRAETTEQLDWLIRGPVDDPYILLDGTEAFSEDIRLSYCDSEACDAEERSVFSPCNLEPTTCDSFTMNDSHSLALDQYHWVGPVGSGYAHITGARGSLYGIDFNVTDHSQLIMTYGHHAFTRSGMVFFDEPIESACGLYIEEVTSNNSIWTIDCDGNLLEELPVTDAVHEYQQGPCL